MYIGSERVKNLSGFFVSDEPKLRNQEYKKKMVLFGPPYLCQKSLKKICILWNVFYNMCKIQKYLIKSTVEKKLMKKGHYLWASPLS